MAARDNKIGNENTDTTLNYKSGKAGQEFYDMRRMTTRPLSPSLDPHRAAHITNLSNSYGGSTLGYLR
jgi:hypothetical protein